MISPPTMQRIGSLDGETPLSVLSGWPRERPVILLHSGQQHAHFGRWSLIAEPLGWVQLCESTSGTLRLDQVGDGPRADSHGSPMNALRALLDGVRTNDTNGPCIGPGWFGTIAYEFGGILEPAARRDDRTCPAYGEPPCPLVEFAWCPDVLAFDHTTSQWLRIRLENVCSTGVDSIAAHGPAQHVVEAPAQFGPLEPTVDDMTHAGSIARTIEYIRAGDVFQTNVTRRYTARCSGSSRAVALAALGCAEPRYGAYIEFPDGRCVISMSPELFFQIDAASRRIMTRPIKGTSPSTSDAHDLWQSGKDAAELYMIVDLMRNDLGRVCEYGSVRVATSRTIETHPTVHHGVAEIVGTLRRDVTAFDVLAATFPAGSITGAPKIRAMQIINELESDARGVYCGAIGFIDCFGNATFNVAIRTITLTPDRTTSRQTRHTLTYGAGGGIVADSVVAEELRECEQKTRVVRDVIAHAHTGSMRV